MRTTKALPIIYLALIGCESYEEDGPPEGVGDAEQLVAPERTTLYSRRKVLLDEGEVVALEVTGALSEHAADRAARPWLYRSEQFAYGDDVTIKVTPDGAIESVYEVFAEPNRDPWVKPHTEGRPEIGAELRQRLETASNEEELRVTLFIRDYPEWDIPLGATTAPLGDAELAARHERRAAALHERKALYAARAAPIAEHIQALGGTARTTGWGAGWLLAKLPASALQQLAAREDLLTMELSGVEVRPGWELGEGRIPERTDADRFLDSGYDGDQPQPSGGRHSYTTMTIGIIEPEILEDEACFFDDGAGCDGTYNLISSFDCSNADLDSNPCEPITTFPDSDPSPAHLAPAYHGTIVASAAVANYRQGQAGTVDVGGVNPDWENEATGFAPEARIVFFGNSTDNDDGYADAYDDAVDLGLDVTNSSWGADWASGTQCSRSVTFPWEAELENAFDDGILNITITHNGAGEGDSSPCEVNSPGDIHKGLTVAAYTTWQDACLADYRACPIGPNRTGGADVMMPNGTVVSRAASLVDLVAPGGAVGSMTDHQGLHGTLAGNSGSSFAAPAVAGMAALLKDMYLFQEETWINNPGRLHTAMLAMGDRHRSAAKSDATAQAVSGTSRLYGLGRVKMRMFASGGGLGSWAVKTGTRALTSSSATERFMPWPSPMPAGTDIFKCVLYQAEDMTDKTTISDVDIRIRTRAPNSSGTCTANSGSIAIETWDLGAALCANVA